MIKILIVDDEKPICDLIDLNLSAAGYFCKSVQDGMKAIECIEREKFDLILLDIMLPGVDGFDIMERSEERRVGKDPGDLHYSQGRCEGSCKGAAAWRRGLSGEAL